MLVSEWRLQDGIGIGMRGPPADKNEVVLDLGRREGRRTGLGRRRGHAIAITSPNFRHDGQESGDEKAQNIYH